MNEENKHDSEYAITMLPSSRKTDFKYQKTIIYNKLLPNGNEIESESQVVLAEIKANLGRAVLMRELTPGCEFWATRLLKYTKTYGMMFSKEDHIKFVKLMYELVSIPNQGCGLLDLFTTVLCRLLQKKELISPDELELPWRPIYDLVTSVKGKGQVKKHLLRYYSTLEPKFCVLINAIKVYFPLSATQEILDELRPMLCPIRCNITNGMELLSWFLPVQLRPQHHALGYELWFQEFMGLWELCINTCWQNDMMNLMAKLATNNIGYIDWEPYVPSMFNRFIHSLSLPITYKNTQKTRSREADLSSIAKWIVSVLGNGSSAQKYLTSLLETITVFYHPANYGCWQQKLNEFSTKLAFHFITRLHKERFATKRTWETPIPDEYKLTDLDIDEFVEHLMPVIMGGMHSKSANNNTTQALNYLATIRPNLVISKVIAQMYNTLDSVTTPHKLISAMSCMKAVARPMVQGPRNMNKGYEYHEGPEHVLPILFSLLPGIDLNDPRKCLNTLHLISTFAVLVPFVDSSGSSAPMSKEENMICAETARFEDFVLQLLDRLFTIIDISSLDLIRLESNAGDAKNKMEGFLHAVVTAVCTSVLMHSSDKIFQSALHKIRNFVTNHIFETNVAGQMAAALCKSFANFNGCDTLRALLPTLSSTILDITEGEAMAKEDNLDKQLLHSMVLLSAIVDLNGKDLLPHKDTLINILDRVLVLKSGEGHDIACEIFFAILTSLTTVSIRKFRYKERDFNDPEYPYVRDWGQPAKLDSFQVLWNMPGEEDIAFARELFFRYLLPEVEKLQRYCKDWSTLTREELQCSLKIVDVLIGGCNTVLPLWNEAPILLRETSVETVPYLPKPWIKAEISMPDGSNAKHYLAGIVEQLQKVVLGNSEDDTKSLLVMSKIWFKLLFGKLGDCILHKMTNAKDDLKKKTSDKLLGNKGHLAAYLLVRVQTQHELHTVYQSIAFTETHKQIMGHLFTLSTCRYAGVRSDAQVCLFYVLKIWPLSYKIIMPRIMDILQSDLNENHDAYKGVLYVLYGPMKNHMIAQNDCGMLRSLWPALVLCKVSEKNSVIRLREILHEAIHKYHTTVGVNYVIREDCLKLASALWESHPKPKLPHPTEDELKEGEINFKQLQDYITQSYTGLLDDLMQAILEGDLHWRHKQMAMQFIQHLAHPSIPYSPKIIRYFLEALIHDTINERSIALVTVVLSLAQQKRKQLKVTVEPSTLSGNVEVQTSSSNKFIPGRRPDNSWLQYDYDTRPVTQEQWDSLRYVNKFHVGYYTWPMKLELYAPSSQQPCLDPSIRELTECEKEFDLFFSNSENIEKLIKLFSLEGKKDKERFCVWRASMFRILFRNHGIVYLKHFVPHLYTLVKDKQESSQRCAAEIICGIASGAKYWPFEMVQEMWETILPIIRLAFSNMTEESCMDWAICFFKALKNRDPNRSYWLLECLAEEQAQPDTETSIIQSFRLYILQAILTYQNWRVSQLMDRLLQRVENQLLSDNFDIVRGQLGSLLSAIFAADLRNPNATQDILIRKVQVFIDKIMPKLRHLIQENGIITDKEEHGLSSKVANISSIDEGTEQKDISLKNRDAAAQVLKIICKWIIKTSTGTHHGVLPNFYQIFPIICQLENCDSDPELAKACRITIGTLAQAVMLPCDIPVVLEAITKISKDPSWGMRSTCLHFLQTIVFYNMSIFLSRTEWVNAVQDIVLSLLEDERLEVREHAGTVLSGLLHCGFIPDPRKLMEEFKMKVKAKRSVNDFKRVKHTGVLGLCAFIQASPYRIPKYMSEILEELAPRINDLQPIPQTITKAINDFKRTHYNSWEDVDTDTEIALKRQLAALTMPLSHYA